MLEDNRAARDAGRSQHRDEWSVQNIAHRVARLLGYHGDAASGKRDYWQDKAFEPVSRRNAKGDVAACGEQSEFHCKPFDENEPEEERRDRKTKEGDAIDDPIDRAWAQRSRDAKGNTDECRDDRGSHD